VDHAAPVIHHTMTAARAKPQVSNPDKFSAPTGSDDASGCDLERVALPGGQARMVGADSADSRRQVVGGSMTVARWCGGVICMAASWRALSSLAVVGDAV
jgi:hypothetical protein